MSRRVLVLVLGLLVILAGGFFVVWLAQGRVDQSRVYCQNHLRILTQQAVQAGQQLPPAALVGPWLPVQTPSLPAGTVVPSSLPPDQRLSWIVPLLPLFDQKLYATESLAQQLDRTRAWDAGPNAAVARTRIAVMLCPGNPPPESDWAPSCYVGNGGVGSDAASLSLILRPAPALPLAPPQAGCFRYDQPTPLAVITDGLSSSVMVAETSLEQGPWLRGGPATIRSYSPKSSRPALGPQGQFGGNHPNGSNWGMADGSVRFLTDRTAPTILEGLMTIAGAGTDPIPGE